MLMRGSPTLCGARKQGPGSNDKRKGERSCASQDALKDLCCADETVSFPGNGGIPEEFLSHRGSGLSRHIETGQTEARQAAMLALCQSWC